MRQNNLKAWIDLAFPSALFFHALKRYSYSNKVYFTEINRATVCFLLLHLLSSINYHSISYF